MINKLICIFIVILFVSCNKYKGFEYYRSYQDGTCLELVGGFTGVQDYQFKKGQLFLVTGAWGMKGYSSPWIKSYTPFQDYSSYSILEAQNFYPHVDKINKVEFEREVQQRTNKFRHNRFDYIESKVDEYFRGLENER